MRKTMKKIIWMPAVLLMGLAAMWGCDDDKTTEEQPAVAPQVTFPVTESAVSAYVDDARTFRGGDREPRAAQLQLVRRRETDGFDGFDDLCVQGQRHL